MKLLTKEEYEAVFTAPMVNVTETAEELVDLWNYADLVIENEYHNCTAWEWKVGYIYETSNGSFQHIGVPVPEDDTYLVVVVDKTNKTIVGHHILNLGKLYSTESPGST